MANNHLRKRNFVDHRVQGSLLLRIVLYWGFCLLTISLMLLCWRIATGPARLFYMHFDDMWFQFGPALVASLLLLPLVLIDSVRLSNRFAGPVFRLRSSLRSLARGEPVPSLHFRDGDFWQEMASDFNTIAAKLQTESPPQPAEAVDAT